MLGRIFLGRYETFRLLGEGGMGRVYLARQTDLGRQVVVNRGYTRDKAYPPQTGATAAAAGTTDVALDADAEAEIMERLQALGYVE